ncbi:MarR family winged helix-turn-helix transcriptional regulator [Halobacillus hunanensis]|uniref:MarR family winged helix-turn-helix transcriptional regulator n=1 Tax=Halobacillus hunanensis TaxID=578214 RepID=UPI0009A8A52B|nr:MarR family transcriptional regulator [Halobacillus hunanensis]
MMKPYKQFFYAYNATYRPYVNQLNHELAEFQLYSSQWRIMHFILHNGGQTVSDIAIYQKVEKPTTTKMVHKLIELGYLQASAGADKRSKVIELTDKGQEICDQVQKKISQFQSYLLEDIPEDEQLIAARLLEHISGKITDYRKG